MVSVRAYLSHVNTANEGATTHHAQLRPPAVKKKEGERHHRAEAEVGGVRSANSLPTLQTEFRPDNLKLQPRTVRTLRTTSDGACPNNPPQAVQP